MKDERLAAASPHRLAPEWPRVGGAKSEPARDSLTIMKNVRGFKGEELAHLSISVSTNLTNLSLWIFSDISVTLSRLGTSTNAV